MKTSNLDITISSSLELPSGSSISKDIVNGDAEKACIAIKKSSKKLKVKSKSKKHHLTKAERITKAHACRDLKIQNQIVALLSGDESRESFADIDTVTQRARVADLYTRAVAKMVRRKVYFFPEDVHLQSVRLLLAYCAELEMTPEFFIKAQLEMLGGFFRAKRIVPKFGVLISDKAIDRLGRYLGMIERSWEKKSELAKIIARPFSDQEADLQQALFFSASVMQQRLERLIIARGGVALTETDVVAELEIMTRAGLVSGVYVALHRLANSTEYLTNIKVSTLEKLNKEIENEFYLSNLRRTFRNHVEGVCSDKVMRDWLL